MPITRFVILAAPRTGSNLLCTLLNSHPRILCHHEVFNPCGIFYAVDHRDGSIDLGSVNERDSAPADFLERLWRVADGATHIGFKMTRGQCEEILRLVLNDDTVHKIILSRANRVRTYVSHLIAEQNGQWEVYDERDLAHGTLRVAVDPDDLKAYAAANANFYEDIRRFLISTRQTWLELMYQDLMSAPTHERLLNFLGAGSAELLTSSIRQNDRHLRAMIENFDELATGLATTDYYAELYELEEMADNG